MSGTHQGVRPARGQLAPASVQMLAEVVLVKLLTETAIHPINCKQECRRLGRRSLETRSQENDPRSHQNMSKLMEATAML